MYDFTQSYTHLIQDCTHEITILANSAAFFNTMMEDVSWVGFYLYENDALILGPFQGPVACTNIAMDKGVCGRCASTRETCIVDDVHTFKGHIACDASTNSELVVPILIEDSLYGVLDLDSTSRARFTREDARILNACTKVLSQRLQSIKA